MELRQPAFHSSHQSQNGSAIFWRPTPSQGQRQCDVAMEEQVRRNHQEVPYRFTNNPLHPRQRWLSPRLLSQVVVDHLRFFVFALSTIWMNAQQKENAAGHGIWTQDIGAGARYHTDSAASRWPPRQYCLLFGELQLPLNWFRTFDCG